MWQDTLWRQLEEVPPGAPVRLHYTQHKWVSPFDGESAYEVRSVKVLEQKAAPFE